MSSLKTNILEQIERSISVKQSLKEMAGVIEEASLIASVALEKGNKILLCGNGGSAADAQHIAAELIVRYKSGNDRAALPAMTLASDPSTLTACGNDYGYQHIFSRSLEAWGKEDDVLIAISTSGNSDNILMAINKAKEMNIKVIGLLGCGGGKMKGKSDIDIVVPSDETARVQEAHILIGHLICSVIEKKLFNLS